MKKPLVRLSLFALLIALGVPAEAQQGGKLFKIGSILSGTGSRPSGGFEALRREIRALGYVEGKNIIFESRYHGGKLDRLPMIADDLIRLKVDLILTFPTPDSMGWPRDLTIASIVLASG